MLKQKWKEGGGRVTGQNTLPVFFAVTVGRVNCTALGQYARKEPKRI